MHLIYPYYGNFYIPLYRRNIFYYHGDFDNNKIYLPSPSSCTKDSTLVSVSFLFPEKKNSVSKCLHLKKLYRVIK